jgi:hypothetical protein
VRRKKEDWKKTCSELFVGIENHRISIWLFLLSASPFLTEGGGGGARSEGGLFTSRLYVTEQSSTGERDGKDRRYGKAFAVSTFHPGFQADFSRSFPSRYSRIVYFSL